jgi:hypothetical protein
MVWTARSPITAPGVKFGRRGRPGPASSPRMVNLTGANAAGGFGEVVDGQKSKDFSVLPNKAAE